jgi:hypothetical protein
LEADELEAAGNATDDAMRQWWVKASEAVIWARTVSAQIDVQRSDAIAWTGPRHRNVAHDFRLKKALVRRIATGLKVWDQSLRLIPAESPPPPAQPVAKPQVEEQVSGVRGWYHRLDVAEKVISIVGGLVLLGGVAAGAVVLVWNSTRGDSEEPDETLSPTTEAGESPSPSASAPSVFGLQFGDDIAASCISNLWTPIGGQAHTKSTTGCWDLSDWGLASGGGELNISSTRSSVVTGMYWRLGELGRIDLTVTLDRLQTRDELNSYLAFGFLVANSPEPSSGFLLLLERESAHVDAPVYLKWRSPGADDQYLAPRWELGKPIRLTFELERDAVRLSLNGDVVATLIGLSVPDPPTFWLGYRVYNRGGLEARISNMEFVPR